MNRGGVIITQIEPFIHVVETTKSFNEALVAVRQTAEANKWRVLGDYDFSEILGSKGFPQAEQVKALDISNPGHADLRMGAERLTALCMPCSVLVYTENGATKLAAMSPAAMMPQLFPESAPRVQAQLHQVTQAVTSILEQAAG